MVLKSFLRNKFYISFIKRNPFKWPSYRGNMAKIGIMLVPEDKDLTSFREALNLEKTDKIGPHITLYIFETQEKNKEEIKRKADSISEEFLPIEINAQGVDLSKYGTLRLLVEKHQKLQKFHEKLVKSLAKFRDKDAFSKAKKFYDEFSPEEQELIDKYGRPNLLQNFEPHITLGKCDKKLHVNFNKTITMDKITIYYDSGGGWIEI